MPLVQAKGLAYCVAAGRGIIYLPASDLNPGMCGIPSCWPRAGDDEPVTASAVVSIRNGRPQVPLDRAHCDFDLLPDDIVSNSDIADFVPET